MEKEYGKVTLDQFQRFIKGLPEIRGQMKELSQAIKAAPREKIREILGQDFSWAKVYERPFVEQIELLFRALVLQDVRGSPC